MEGRIRDLFEGLSEVPASELNTTAHSSEAAGTAITKTDLIEQLRRTGAHAQPLPFSEDALAHRFVQEHGEHLRYVPTWDRWMLWDGVRWKSDSPQRALNNARIICRGVSRTCNESRLARSLASARTASAILQLAKADPRICTTVDVWDRDPWLLNTPGGTMNLRTGRMHPCECRDYITKVTAVAPKGECPLWRKFLVTITASNRELELYLQRMAGYALTGVTTEHALFYEHGTGANGKSTFNSTVSGVVLDYATHASMNTFVATKSEQHPTELAGLRGARLVIAVETDQGQRWSESKIKTFTGGDKIVARFMRQDFFEYDPQFKLLIAGNHKPGLRGVDEAMRRRMNLVPFTVTIPRKDRDPNLTEKLRQEWPGILKWMIEGCAMWVKHGLMTPAVVSEATDEYLAEEDTIARWLGDRCVTEPHQATMIASLYADYRTWAEGEGEYVCKKRELTQALRDRGFSETRIGHHGARGFSGLRLKPPEVLLTERTHIPM